MIRNAFLLVIILIPLLSQSQFSDNFSDGDFTQNPAWIGESQKFIIENQILRLNDNQAGQAYLATASSLIHNTQWEFWVRLAFTPSNNNHPRIYLVSDNANLAGPLNGYYIRIGKDGGDNKRIYFFRQTGEIHTEIMAGSQNIATTTNNLIRIKVTRDALGNWEFFADPAGNIFFAPQGTVTDNQITTTQWFGIHCFYTSSNANRFYFDDFYVGQIIVDTLAPSVEQILVPTQNTLEILFSEAVLAATAENPLNYFVGDGIGNPVSAIVPALQPDRVILFFSQSFDQGKTYSLTIQNVSDLSQNVMEPYTGEFYWYEPQKHDIVFNELMIDPTPTVLLPAHEYIELFNTSAFDINLEGWVFQHGSTRRTLPFAIVPSQGFLVLSTTAGFDELKDFGNVVAVPNLSSTALTNAGALLQLFDQQMKLIDFVEYSESWYSDASRANGGFSLEKTDPFNFCGEGNNWRASIDPRGGTPGEVNSVRANNPDTIPPTVLRAGYESENTISLFFSEPMDAGSLTVATSYFADNGPGNPVEIILFPPLYKRVDLIFGSSLAKGIVYNLQISSVTDCAGNTIAPVSLRVGVPEQADSLDMVINEILFNPPDRGVRYVEIYNRSRKVIDLQHYVLSSMDTIDGVLTTIRDISPESLLIFPDEYLVITPDPDIVRSQFMTPNPRGFVRAALPSMTNVRGIVVLASKGLRIIDKMIYREEMHYSLLTNRKGVALERLNYHRPTLDPGNWHSAARNVGFGTPGFKNSQFTLNVAATDDTFEVYPRIFSPDNDGVDDVLNISYQLERPGFTAGISIYDSRGRRIRTLTRSELLGTSGILTWDGTTDDFQKADMGIYIILIELFEPGGTVKVFRKTAVVGGRL